MIDEVKKFKQALEQATAEIKKAKDVIEDEGPMAALKGIPAAKAQFEKLGEFGDPKKLAASIGTESPEDQESVQTAISSFLEGIKEVEEKAGSMVASLMGDRVKGVLDDLEQVKASLKGKAERVTEKEKGQAT